MPNQPKTVITLEQKQTLRNGRSIVFSIGSRPVQPNKEDYTFV